MAKFHIGTPGGYDVEVTADSEDQALSIAKERWENLPRVLKYAEGGGRVLEQAGKRFFVSPGYSTADPARIEQIMQGADAGALSRQSFDEQAIAAAPVAARATKFVEGVPFVGTYVDEALGAVLGKDAQAGIRAQSAAMERQRPGQSLAANLAGGLLTGAAGAAALPAGALPSAVASLRTVPGAAAGAALGAAGGGLEGVVSGAGRGTDSASRQTQAAQGALFGTAAGGLLGAAVPLATKGIQNVVGMFRRSDVQSIARDLGISPDAARVIKNTFDQGGDFTAARANLARAGQEGMLADAGEAAQALLDATAASGGPAAQTVRGAVDARASRSYEGLLGALGEALGPAPIGPQSAISSIAQRTAPQRNAAYAEAFSRGIDYSSPEGVAVMEALGRISPRVLNQAIGKANEQMLADGIAANLIKATTNEAGEVVLSGAPNVQQLHQIKVALGSLAEDAKGEFGKATSDSRLYSGLASRLRSAIGGAVPEYNQAVKLGGDKIAEQSAFELGASLLRPQTTVEDAVLGMGKNPSDAQMEAARSGLRGAIEKTLGDVRSIASDPNMDARQLRQALNVLSSDNAKAKVRAILGGGAEDLAAAAQTPEGRAALEAQVGRRVDSVINGLLDGSSEADRALEEMVGPELSGNVFDRLASGDADVRAEIFSAAMARVSELASSPSVSASSDLRKILRTEADALIEQIDQAEQTLLVRAAVARNSATASRQAVQGSVKEMTAPGLLGTAMRGEPVDATKRMVQAITGQTDEYTATQRQRLYQDIARALTEKRGPAAQKALDNLQRALAGQSITEAQTSEIAKALADVGFVAGATTGTRGLLAEEQRLAQ